MPNNVNLTTPIPSLTVAGYDCTPLLTSGKLSYSSWNPGTGLLVTLGEFQLNYSHEFPESLDPKRNNRWSFGRKVVFRLDGLLAPIGGTTYIESSSWDNENLVLNTTCKLGILNSKTPGSIGICIDISSNAGLGRTISYLLQKAGIPEADIDVSLLNGVNIGTLESRNVPAGQSLISYSASLALGQGYVIYQKRDGKITLGDITSLIKKPLAFNLADFEVADYSRSSSLELPPSSIKLTGSVYDKYFTDTFVATVVTTPEYTVYKNTEINFGARKIINKSTKVSNSDNLASEETIEVSYYEGSSTGSTFSTTEDATDGSAKFLNSDSCLETDEARLYRVKRQTTSNALGALKAWNEVGLAAGTIKPAGLTQGNVVSENYEETISYSLPTLSPIVINKTLADTTNSGSTTSGGGGGKVTQIKTTKTILGKEVPILAKFLSQAFSVNPLTQITSEKEITQWKLDTNLKQWRKKRTVFRTRYSYSPEQIQAEAANSGPLSAYNNAIKLILVLEEVSDDNPPPDFGRMPAIAYTQQTPFEVNYQLTTNKVREASYSLGDTVCNASDSVAIAETYGKWLVGKANAHTVVIPTYRALVQPDLFVPCLSTFTIWEPLYDTVYHYAIDSPTLLIQADQSVISLTGIYLGSQGKYPLPPESFATQPPSSTTGDGDLPLNPSNAPLPNPGDDSVFESKEISELNLEELVDGEPYPGVLSENPRVTPTSENPSGGSFANFLPSFGGINWKSPTNPQYPNLSEQVNNETFGKSEQEFINQAKGGDSGGGGGGGDPQGGSGFFIPSGAASLQPIQGWGFRPGNNNSGGSGGGGGMSGIGTTGSLSGSNRAYNPSAYDSNIKRYLFEALYTEFPRFYQVIPDGTTLTIEGFLDNSEDYMAGKSSPLLLL